MASSLIWYVTRHWISSWVSLKRGACRNLSRPKQPKCQKGMANAMILLMIMVYNESILPRFFFQMTAFAITKQEDESILWEDFTRAKDADEQMEKHNNSGDKGMHMQANWPTKKREWKIYCNRYNSSQPKKIYATWKKGSSSRARLGQLDHKQCKRYWRIKLRCAWCCPEKKNNLRDVVCYLIRGSSKVFADNYCRKDLVEIVGAKENRRRDYGIRRESEENLKHLWTIRQKEKNSSSTPGTMVPSCRVRGCGTR